MGHKLILAIDPGEKNNGMAFFKWDDETRKADLKFMEVFSQEQIFSQLKLIHDIAKVGAPLEIVIENFRVDPNNFANRGYRGKSNLTFQWSEMKTSRIIGAVEFVAHSIEAPLTFQEPGILGMARKWCDLPLPKGHIPDDKSAYIHGVHYMREKNYIRTPDDVTKFGQAVIG